MSDPDLDLEALREVVDAATALPWYEGDDATVRSKHDAYALASTPDPADAALIVAAVNALPMLLDRVAELEAKLDIPALAGPPEHQCDEFCQTCREPGEL